jgi:hypothetical protein
MGHRFDGRPLWRAKAIALALATAATASLWAAAPALAQDDAGTDPSTGSADAVRSGWTLHTSDDPMFSIQVPAGWAVDPASDDLFGATGPAGESLVVRLDDSAPGEPFEGYSTRIEGVLEAELNEPVPTVLRTVPGGLVARLDLPSDGDEVATSRFLFAPCADGARVLEIAGPATDPSPDGAPDAWDRIAASVSPCSTEPVAEIVLDPATAELAAAYFTTALILNDRIGRAIDRVERRQTYASYRRNARRVSAEYADGRKRIAAYPWTPETRSLAKPLLDAYADQVAVFRKLGRATTDRQVQAGARESIRNSERIAAAGRAIRLAIGLPTLPS